MNTILVTAIILVKNEEDNIEKCLRALRWYDEIIVIDDNSTDQTREIAEKMGAKVYQHALNNDFAAQRNFGLEKAKHEWVLFVDADERISDTLASEIILRITRAESGESGFYVKRIDTMWGKELRHGETGDIKLLRLAKKNAGKWERKVHEEWKVKGKIGELQNPMLHYPHQSMTEFLKEINFYTDLRAQELYDKRVRVNGLDIVLYPKGKFIINYFLKGGFLDGMPGLIVALLMSFHSFLVRGKLWILWERK